MLLRGVAVRPGVTAGVVVRPGCAVLLRPFTPVGLVRPGSVVRPGVTVGVVRPGWSVRPLTPVGAVRPDSAARPVVPVGATRPFCSSRPVVAVPVRPVFEFLPETPVPDGVRGASMRPLFMADSYLSPKVDPLPLPELPLRPLLRWP